MEKIDKLRSSIGSFFESNIIFRNIFIVIIVLVILFLLLVQLGFSFNSYKESFETMERVEKKKIPAGCPVSAKRGQDGKIHVVYNAEQKPGQLKSSKDKTIDTTELTFETLQDYVDYLNALYKTNNKCVPPKVQNYRSPVMGVIGGLGTGIEDKKGISIQSASRNIMDDHDQSEHPYSTSPINKLDDYEATFIYENERGSRTNAMSKAAKNQLTE
jgi:hypothetical protein